MFERFFSKKHLILNLEGLSRQKLARVTDAAFMLGVVDKQLGLLSFLSNSEKKGDDQILTEIASCLDDSRTSSVLEMLGGLSVDQRRILRESLKVDIAFIRKSLSDLNVTLLSQREALKKGSSGQDYSNLRNLVHIESQLLGDILQKINEESGLKKKLDVNYAAVKKLEHSSVFRSITEGVASIIHAVRFNVVVSGSENIPVSGPVIIAPRHFHGDFDPSLMKKIIKRDFFFLAATDWAKGGMTLKVVKWAFQKEGAVTINRLDSIFAQPNSHYLSAFKKIVNLLSLNQAVVVFPEGYGHIDANYTPANEKDGFLELKLGVFHFVDYTQKKIGAPIPIVPVGTHYENWKSFGSIISVNIGRPIFIPLTNEKMDYSKYKDLLDEEIRRLSAPKRVSAPAEAKAYT